MRFSKLAPACFMCLAAVLMVCAEAQAQRGGGRGPGGPGGFGGGRGGFGFGGPLGLVQREDVQEELSLTSAQQEQIEALRDELRPGRGQDGERFGNFRDLSDEERQQRFAQLREQREKQQEQAQARLKDILNTNQAKRLAELELQFALQRLQSDGQLAVLATYIDQDKLQAAIGEPFEFEGRGGGFGQGGRRGDRGGPGAGQNNRDRGASEDAATGGRRGRRGN